MGFNLFKKKSVPEELPSLAVDDLNKISGLPPTPEASKYKPLPKPVSQSFSPTVKNPEKVMSQPEDEQGYFKDLIKSVTEETKNLDKLDSWYKNKFLPGDMVFQMREYWEKQRPELLLKNISGDLKNRLMEKTNHLHGLEKEWQDIYFHLLSKEDEIRKEEKELKNSLSEFIGVFKKSMGDKESNAEVDLSKLDRFGK